MYFSETKISEEMKNSSEHKKSSNGQFDECVKGMKGCNRYKRTKGVEERRDNNSGCIERGFMTDHCVFLHNKKGFSTKKYFK